MTFVIANWQLADSFLDDDSIERLNLLPTFRFRTRSFQFHKSLLPSSIPYCRLAFQDLFEGEREIRVEESADVVNLFKMDVHLPGFHFMTFLCGPYGRIHAESSYEIAANSIVISSDTFCSMSVMQSSLSHLLSLL